MHSCIKGVHRNKPDTEIHFMFLLTEGDSCTEIWGSNRSVVSMLNVTSLSLSAKPIFDTRLTE